MTVMRKHLISLAILLIAAAAAVSCTTKEENEGPSITEMTYRLSFDPEVKTVLSSPENGKADVNWADGDRIMYYTGSGGVKTADVNVDGGSASVTIYLSSPDDNYIYAVYGGVIDDSGSGADKMRIQSPALDVQSYTSFSDAHACAAFKTDVFDPDMHFLNVTGILRFTSAPGVSKVVIRGNNDETITAGSGLLDLAYSNGTLLVAAPSQGSKTVTVITSGQSRDFFVSILPVNFKQGITILGYDSSDNLVKVQTTGNSISTVSNSGKPRMVGLGNAANWEDYVEPVIEPDYYGFVVSDLSSTRIPYTCNEDNLSVEAGSLVTLEDYLAMDYAYFRKYYIPELKKTNPVTTNPSVYVLETYILKNGRSGRSESDYTAERLDNSDVNSDFKYGTITFVPDAGYSPNDPGSTANDCFRISLTKAQKDQLRVLNGKTVTLYAHFYHNYTHFMLGFKIKLDNDASVQLLQHNPTYWFNDIDGYNNTVRRNVRVPDQWRRNAIGNTDVTVFDKLLTDDWVYHTIQLSPAVSGNVVIEWTFAPQAQQPAIANPFGTGSKRWKVSQDGSTLYYQSTYPVGTGYDHAGMTTVNDPVVTLDPQTGLMTFVHPNHAPGNGSLPDDDPDYISKALLNMYPSTAYNVSEKLYCKVRLAAYSTDDASGCRILLGEEIINLRFLRPLYMLTSADVSFHEGMPMGETVPIGRLFSLYDWNPTYYYTGFPLFVYNSLYDEYRPAYYPDAANPTVEWYGYYGVRRITVDIDNILVERSGTRQDLKSASISARIWLAKKDNAYASLPTNTLDIETADKLGEYVLAFANNTTDLSGSTLLVPISVEYAWGELKDYVSIPVN